MKLASLGSLAVVVLFLGGSPLAARGFQVSEDLLTSLINGKILEIGKKESSNRYELYEYEEYKSNGCTIEWKETHRVFENLKHSLSTIETTTVDLMTIDVNSLAKSRFYTGHVISFTTKQLQPRIKHRGTTAYGDMPEDSSNGLRSGAGFYLASGSDATKLFDELKRRIQMCNK